MQSALRPYATAGVAIVGASVIAVTPVAAPLPDAGTFRDVALTAGDATLGDIVNPWIDQYNTAVTDYTQIANNYYLAPGVGMQQFMVNSAELLKELFNDPSKLGDVAIETQDNLNTVLELAASQNRVLITRNSRDFAPLAREWAEAQRSHAGIILIWSLDHSQFKLIVEGIESHLQHRSRQKDWRDIVVAI